MRKQVDILTWRNKAQRIHVQIRDICSILSGLVVAQDYRRGQDLIRDRDFKENEGFFQVSGARYEGTHSKAGWSFGRLSRNDGFFHVVGARSFIM